MKVDLFTENTEIFSNALIGRQTHDGIELKNGDFIKIEVCKPDGANKSGVYHSGQIIYENCAFCINVKTNLLFSSSFFTVNCFCKSIY